MKKYHYVYRITNLVTKMYYYGSRSSICHPNDDIGINYFSSFSKPLFELDQKENPQDYKYKIIKIFETNRNNANNLEIKLHEKFNVKLHKSFINRANQTKNGFSTAGLYGKDNPLYGFKHSEDFCKDISKRQKGNQNSFYGKHHSEESKIKIREKTTGENNHFLW